MCVSVIIPVYNGAKYIGETINSLLIQGEILHEIIIVDDNSTDSTCEVVESLACEDSRIKLYRFETNQGVSAARNFGMNSAVGDWVLFFDGDDLADPLLLKKEFSYLKEMQNRGYNPVLLHTAYQQINETGEKIGDIIRWKQVLPHEVFGYLIIRNPIITSSGALARRDVLMRTGGFNPELHYSEDWDLWLKLAQHGAFGYVDEPLVLVRRHPHNVSKSVANMLKGERKVLEQYTAEAVEQAIFRRELPWEVNSVEYASLLFRLDQWEKGYSILEQVVTVHPKYASGWFAVGIYHLKKRNWEKARQSFEETLRLDSRHGAALNNLGALLAVQGRNQDGLHHLNLALKLFPGYLDSTHNLRVITAHGAGSPGYEELRFTWRELRPALLKYSG